MAVANTLAYCDMATINSVKSFSRLALGRSLSVTLDNVEEFILTFC
jgi:hypothetical protein